jgi:hypothetical protein
MSFEKQIYVASGSSDATPATGEVLLTATAPVPAKIVKVVASMATANDADTTFDVAVNGVVVLNEVATVATGAKKGVLKIDRVNVDSETIKVAQGKSHDATPPAGGNTTAPEPGVNYILPVFPQTTGLAEVEEGDIVTVAFGASVGDDDVVENVTVVFEKK